MINDRQGPQSFVNEGDEGDNSSDQRLNGPQSFVNEGGEGDNNNDQRQGPQSFVNEGVEGDNCCDQRQTGSSIPCERRCSRRQQLVINDRVLNPL